jgi:hypothetical protein
VLGLGSKPRDPVGGTVLDRGLNTPFRMDPARGMTCFGGWPWLFGCFDCRFGGAVGGSGARLTTDLELVRTRGI